MLNGFKDLIQNAAFLSRELCSFVWNITAPVKVNIDRVDKLLPRPDDLLKLFIKRSNPRNQQSAASTENFSLQIVPISEGGARANRDVCRSILAIGVTGDKHHQNKYEEKRLVQFSNMPKWVQDGCRKEMESAVEGGIKVIQRAKKIELVNSSKGHERLEITLGIVVLKTFAEMSSFLNISRNYCKSEGGTPPVKTKHGEAAHATLSPASTSVLGPIARSVFDRGARYLLTARLLLDITEMVKVKLDEKSMLEFVKYHKDDPWGVVRDPKLLRMFRVRNHLDSSPEARLDDGSPKYSASDEQRLLKSCLIVYPPELVTDASKGSAQQGVGKNLERANIEGVERPQNKIGNVLKNEAIEGINALITYRGYPADRGVARELFKKIKKGAATFQQLDEGLSRGLAPQDLLQSLEAEYSQNISEDRQTSDSSGSGLALLRTDDSKREAGRSNAIVNLSRVSKTDFSRLDKSDKETVLGSLVDFKDKGLSGIRWKKLTEPSKVIELKPGSMRIYLTQVGENEYTVLKIGPKNTQKRDIAWLKKLKF